MDNLNKQLQQLTDNFLNEFIQLSGDNINYQSKVLDFISMYKVNEIREIHSEGVSFLGEILEVLEDTVIINCIISNDPEPYFQKRSFDIALLKDRV